MPHTCLVLLCPITETFEPFVQSNRGLINEPFVVIDFGFNQQKLRNVAALNDTSFDYTNGVEAMNRIVDSFGSTMRERLQTLLEMCPELWCARFTELNFADPLWMNELRVDVIRNAIATHAPETILIYGDTGECFDALQRDPTCKVTLRSEESTTQRMKRRFKDCLRPARTWLHNLIREREALRTIPADHAGIRDAEVAVLCHVPANWKISDDGSSYRFSGGAFANSSPEHHVYLASVTRQHKTHLNSSQENASKLHTITQPIHVTEQWSRWGEIIRAYFFRDQSNTSSRKRLDVIRTMSPSLPAADIERQNRWVDAPKQHHYKTMLKHALRAMPGIRKALIPIFELVEGRAAALACHESNVEPIGIQHGTLGVLHRWRVAQATGALYQAVPSSVPKRFLVEGSLPKEWMHAVGIEPCTAVGAPRLRALPPEATPDRYTTNTVLILLDMHRWPDLLESTLASAAAHDSVTYIVRAHPSQRDEVRRSIPQESRAVQVDTVGSLEDSLETNAPQAVIATETGAVIEIAMQGWPCFLIEGPSVPMYNPLAAGCDAVQILPPEPDSIRTVLENSSGETRSRYADQLKACALQHIAHYGIEADEALRAALDIEPAS